VSVHPLLADVALDVPGRDAYSYAVSDALAEDLAVGDCVVVPFGRRQERGFVVALAHREPPAGITLKAIAARRADVRLPAHLLALIQWGAHYYRCSLGEFLAGAVPAPVRTGAAPERERSVIKVAGFTGTLTARQQQALAALPDEALDFANAVAAAGCSAGVLARLATAGAVTISATRSIQEVRLEARDERFPLTGEQQVAVDAVAGELAAGRHAVFLLYGVTGSGKTLVYLDLAERVIAAGRQALVLVPEIALTPQLAARVRRRFTRVAILHSGFTDGERAQLWRECAAGTVDIVLGTRSALFAPLPRPGLIVVDEEHEGSYKQESVPRYHARDLAVVYGQQLAVPVVLGSATPSVESVHNVHAGRYRVLTLRQRPLGGRLPTPLLIDMRAECQAQHRHAVLSRELVARLIAAQAAGEQAIVLLNRRGWSPVVSCQDCGAALGCPNCAITLTYHKAASQVRCHYCNHQQPLPRLCPACQQPSLSTFGLGTEQLAEQVATAVPGLRVLRVDADTVSGRQGHATLFKAFAEGAADCLVGTQMVAKGLDFPRVTVVGVIAADRGLSVPDFRSAERTFQLVAQVAGRAGRGERPGTVVVQAFDTTALALTCAIDHATKRFYDEELRLRQEYGYPPHGGLVRLLWSGEDQAKVQLAAQAAKEPLLAVAVSCALLGPSPAGLAFLKGQHRWHALIKAPSRGGAQAFLDRLAAAGGLPTKSGVRLAVDVDPYVTG